MFVTDLPLRFLRGVTAHHSDIPPGCALWKFLEPPGERSRSLACAPQLLSAQMLQAVA